MRKTVLFTVLFLLGLLMVFTGCDSEISSSDTTNTTSSDSVAYVRFIHAASSTGDLDIAYESISDEETYYDLVTGVEYNSWTGYWPFYSGERTFLVYHSGTSVYGVEDFLNLAGDQVYSLVMVDFNATLAPTFLALRDTLFIADKGEAIIRFIHASSDAPAINIANATGQYVSNLEPFSASSYLLVNAGTYALSVSDATTDTVVLNMRNVTLLSGVNYTIVISGSLDGMTPVEINAVIFQDISIDSEQL